MQSYTGLFAILERNMYDRILNRMRDLVRARKYVMTVHAEDEMNSDGLTIYDNEKKSHGM